MGLPRAGGEGLDLQPPVADDDRLARRHRLDALRGEAEVHQGHALAGRGKQRPLDRIAQRLDAQRIAGDDHVAQGIEKDQAVGAVELARQSAGMTSTSGGCSSAVKAWQISCMKTSVSVSRARWLLSSASSSVAQLRVVGQLAVEGEAEPLVLLDVVPLEGLGVAAVVRPAGGVADVADRRPARRIPSSGPRTGPDGSCGRPRRPCPRPCRCRSSWLRWGLIGRHAGRQLAAVLDVQQHPRHQAADRLRPAIPGTRG